VVPEAHLGRRRFKVVGSDGQEYGLALPRSVQLSDGAVLALDASRAVVVEAAQRPTLRLCPTSTEGALQLGFHAGHLHWRVTLGSDELAVALEGPPDEYLDRIRPWLDSGAIKVLP
jgi:urease accessory protein